MAVIPTSPGNQFLAVHELVSFDSLEVGSFYDSHMLTVVLTPYSHAKLIICAVCLLAIVI
jgi:hypothetical protein